MIWTTVSSRSCFCWLYTTSPSLAAKNKIWFWDRVISWVVGKGCLLWPACSLDKVLLVFSLLHFVLQGQTCLLFQVTLDFLLLHSNPLWWKGYLLFGVSSRRSCRSHRNCQLQLFGHQWLGHRLGLLWYRIVFLGKKSKSFCCFFWLHLSTRFQTFVDHDGYFISSKTFLPTLVDIMVIWIKFKNSHPF